MDVWTAIATVGFPIVACVAVSVGYYKATKDFAATIRDINDTHKEEVKEMATAVNNNTIMLNRILEVERMEDTSNG